MSAPHADDEPTLDFDEDDDDVSVSLLSRERNISATASASTRSLATPSQHSRPSGVLINTIARLTHDELTHNPEFMRNVNMVVSLQELLSLRQKSPMSNGELSPLPSFYLTFFSAPTAPLRPSEVAPGPDSGGITSLPRLPLPLPRPFTRPACYPQSVIWTWEDCKNDYDVGASASNLSRPPMRRAIRDERGDMISDPQWKSIRQSATIIAHSHLDVLRTSSVLAAGQPRKKKFYKRFFLKEWRQALVALEAAAPLLSICFDAWKADLTLGSVMQDERPSDDSYSAPPSSPSHSAPPSLAGSASRASTPSSLARPPSGLARRPSNLGRSSHPATPSRSSTPSSVAPASRAPKPSPRRASFKSTQPRVPSGSVQPRPAGKASGSKSKRQRDSSPTLRTGKRSKVTEDVAQRRPPSPRPVFFSMVQSGAASQPVSNVPFLF